jgi:hypothetical protein
LWAHHYNEQCVEVKRVITCIHYDIERGLSMSILRAILNFLYGILLGCRHDRLTRPFTIDQQTYKVCLDCGRHLFYSTDTMRPLKGRDLRRQQAVQAAELKVMPAANTGITVASKRDSRAIA